MSIFTDLGIPSRTISYTVIHQAGADIGDSQKGAVDPPGKVNYDEDLRAFLESALAESAAIRDAFQSSASEARIKSSQVAKGSLNQYLSTPIKSDNEDVQRIIKEALEKYSDLMLRSANIGISDAWASRLLPDARIVNSQTKLSVLVRKMLAEGKKKLKTFGFSRGKNHSNIFETVFLLETGVNLDVLELILHKSAGLSNIWNSAENTWTGIYNVLWTVGTPEQKSKSWESSLFPQTPGAPEFIAGLEKIIERLSKEFNLHQLSLWQNKFPLGGENMYSVRIRTIPDQKLLFEIIRWLGLTDNENLRKALTTDASLVVKEIIS